MTARAMTISVLGFAALLGGTAPAPAAAGDSDWLAVESEHFVVVYREPYAHLAPHILRSAERSLARLAPLFGYTPSERITIVAHSGSDYGGAAATAVPDNVIRLGIEPLELGYEKTPHTERIQWLLNHELVHVIVADLAGPGEREGRALFTKMQPEGERPLTIPFSLLTAHRRYTPLWHQEGIAVFMETWLSGGYGRALSSFDEMYFRALIADGGAFPTPAVLEGRTTRSSFLLNMAHYLYGTRFLSYLATTHGVGKLLDWYRPEGDGALSGPDADFERTFGVPLERAWQDFARSESEFQRDNLTRLSAAPLTPLRRIGEPVGWVGRAFLDRNGDVLFPHHEEHRLSALARLDLGGGALTDVARLQTPSLTGVTAAAYDPERRRLFFTTNNSTLYRDVHTLDLTTGESRLLFEDVRTGDLTVSEATGELWGIRHSGGSATLVRAAPPYERLLPVIRFEDGDALQQLAVSPSGRLLAATLHRSNGEQSIIVADLVRLERTGRFTYRAISDEGSPEFPAWSPDEETLYWNAYTNGVSNIYRKRRTSGQVEAVSHTLRGLVRPLPVSDDSLFAFEFTSEGFVPVILPDRAAARLPAIRYYGQQVVERNPEVATWSVASLPQRGVARSAAHRYSGLSHLRLQALAPAVSGYRGRTVVGLFGRLGDPLGVHDLSFELGVSPFDGRAAIHFRGEYELRRTYRVSLEHQAGEFGDLISGRSTALGGTRLALGHTHYWRYDQPHERRQESELSLQVGGTDPPGQVTGSGLGLLRLQTSLVAKNTRRAIGSVDAEFGDQWNVTAFGLASRDRGTRGSAGLEAQWSRFHTVLAPHNVVQLQLAAGWIGGGIDGPAGRFYFGGFGNRGLESQGPRLYREPRRFAGIPEFSLTGRAYGRLMIEHGLPPLRFADLRLGSHQLTHAHLAWFTQTLWTDAGGGARINLGAQLDLGVTHWSTLDSTLSLGVAVPLNGMPREPAWLLSLKLLRG